MWFSQNWKDYELLDTSDGERLERWGEYILIRPDPQIIWKNAAAHPMWKHADGIYRRSSSGGGAWVKTQLPKDWKIKYGDLGFVLRPMGFKHTGLFPEQAANWDWFSDLIRRAGRPIKVLNLFAYTGGATVAAAKAGASVVHVDASKGIVAQAKENAALSGLADAPIRYIVDDCKKFVEREIRRGNHYDGIIMDPPSYGRGPGGEVWKLEDSIDELITLTARLLSDEPLFFLVNSYTTGLSPLTMSYLLELNVRRRFGGELESGELGLRVTQTGAFLPCGASSRWYKA
ncbi:MAG: class I SAM-dependent methyltransferase [Clostridia bacterium]|nr:class I SAM-dependent methyltransferase [Clostridia bacterium]